MSWIHFHSAFKLIFTVNRTYLGGGLGHTEGNRTGSFGEHGEAKRRLVTVNDCKSDGSKIMTLSLLFRCACYRFAWWIRRCPLWEKRPRIRQKGPYRWWQLRWWIHKVEHNTAIRRFHLFPFYILLFESYGTIAQWQPPCFFRILFAFYNLKPCPLYVESLPIGLSIIIAKVEALVHRGCFGYTPPSQGYFLKRSPILTWPILDV